MKEVGMSKGIVLGITILLVGGVAYTLIALEPFTKPCDPKAAEAKLANLSNQGILGVGRPPSLSNLLWVHVGPEWHALPKKERASLDRIVRCAATTIDDQGQPTWQAAYYDHETGKLVALTSRQYGFRLKNP
jgi:hypothetical protein